MMVTAASLSAALFPGDNPNPLANAADAAIVMLDWITSGEMSLKRPDDARKRGLVYDLTSIAIHAYAERYKLRKRAQNAWLAHGQIWQHDRYERHIACLFCRESLASFARRVSVHIDQALTDRLNHHTLQHALMFLAVTGQPGSIMAKGFKPKGPPRGGDCECEAATVIDLRHLRRADHRTDPHVRGLPALVRQARAR